jgi:hypothetical protein
MAYNLRYYNEFTSLHYRRLVRVEILERDYSGSSEQIKMGASIHLSDSGDGREEPIKKLTASLRLLSTKNFQFEHLFTADDKKYQVKIIRNSSTVFRGFLESDSYSEPYYSWKNYTVNLTARDNLGRLEDIPYLDGLGDRVEGLETILTVLNRVLLKTGLDLNFYDNIGLWSSDMTQSTIMIQQAYVNNDAFWNFDDNEPLSCLEVVTNILSGLGSQIRQTPRGWVIYDQAKYYNLDTVQGNSASFPSYLASKLNFPLVSKAFKWINRDAEMSILPSWKEFAIEQDYLYIENAFRNFPQSIDDFTKIEDGSGRRTNKYYINNWNMQDVPYVYASESGSFRIPNLTGVIGSLISEIMPVKSSDSDVEFLFNAKTVYSGGRTGSVIDDIRIDILLITNQTTQAGYILKDNGWDTYTGSETKELVFENINSADDYQELTITSEGIPADGDLMFRLWPSENSRIGYKDIGVRFIDQYSDDDIFGKEINCEINENNNISEDGFEISIGQSPYENGNVKLTYAGALVDSSGVAQVDWKRSGDTTAKDLLEQVAIGYDLQNRQSARQVNGTVIWDYDVWTNIDDQNKRLMINSIDEWNMNTDEMTAEWVEVFEYKNTKGDFNDDFNDDFENETADDYQTDTTFTITEKYE